MNSHKNARLTALGRAELVRRVLVDGQAARRVATSFGVCVKTVCKWVARFEAEGEEGLCDRSSRPQRLHRPTPIDVMDRIAALRRERWTGKRIAAELGVSPATVSRVLRRLGMSRMRDLEPPEPVRRYERARPGELIHIDIKKLGRFERVGHRITGDRRGQSNSRGVGWEYVHVCVDDHSRLAFTSIYPNEKAVSAIAFLRGAIRYYASLGVHVERVMTDNGSCYKSHAFRDACKALGLRHIRTKPYTPKTNGKAERFIKTALNEWAYARAYQTSDQRADHLPEWTHSYNWNRPHGGIGSQRPISRLALNGDNLLRLHN
jgi:transposase InsO family protein